MGFLKLGRVTLDGTKVKANASKHSALSWGHIQKLEKQLREEVQELMGFSLSLIFTCTTDQESLDQLNG